MSGGSWDYAYRKVLYLGEDLGSGSEVERGYEEDPDDHQYEQVYPLRSALGKALENLAMEALKSIEYSDSGDYADDDWVEPVRAFLERRPIDLPEVREFYDKFLAGVEAPHRSDTESF